MKHTFFPLDPNRFSFTEKRIQCPKCHQLLHRSDIEEFYKCPFCCEAFPKDDPELEDFFLAPITQEWISQQQQLFVSPANEQTNEGFLP